jgi:hypothetical protein
MRDYVTLAGTKDRVIAAGRGRRAFMLPTLALLTIILIPFHSVRGSAAGDSWRGLSLVRDRRRAHHPAPAGALTREPASSWPALAHPDLFLTSPLGAL